MMVTVCSAKTQKECHAIAIIALENWQARGLKM